MGSIVQFPGNERLTRDEIEHVLALREIRQHAPAFADYLEATALQKAARIRAGQPAPRRTTVLLLALAFGARHGPRQAKIEIIETPEAPPKYRRSCVP